MKKTLLKIVKAFTPKPAELHEKTYLQLFREFNERDAIQNNHKEKTKSKHKNFCDNLETFLKSKNSNHLYSLEITPGLIEDFRFWLHTNLSTCGLTHSSKHINRCKKVMDYAITKGFIQYNLIAALKTKRDPIKQIVNFENDEFTKWVNTKFTIEPFKKAHELSIFQVTTGLSYMDLSDYETTTDEHNRLWIEGKRGKNGKPYYVPLFHEDFKLALQLHIKYNGKLPFLNNATYNRYIKEMAAITGIKKHLTTHTFRKTFATIKDQQGWDIGPISAILGNTETICRDHYINTSRKKIEIQLRKLA